MTETSAYDRNPELLEGDLTRLDLIYSGRADNETYATELSHGTAERP